MCATISTSPDFTSVATAVISPSASNFGAKAKPSSTSAVEPRAANDDLSVKIRLAVNAGRLTLRPTQHGHETNLLVGILAERAGEMRGNRHRAGFRHPAQRHAHMLGLDHHRDAARLEDLVNRGRDLRVEMFLRLQAPRIDIEQTRQLR